MLYEFVFAYGDVPSGFEIYNLIPRKVLPMNNTPFCISTSTTLVVEWTDESITSFAKQFDIHQVWFIHHILGPIIAANWNFHLFLGIHITR